MRKRTVPRLAAAFVVTVAGASAGCDSGPKYPPNPPPPESQITRQPDGTCMETISGNPPMSRVVPCPGDPVAPTATAPATTSFATPPDKPGLPKAPDGWRVQKHQDGTCTAYGPDPCNHPGCNPPPPMDVACPPDSK